MPRPETSSFDQPEQVEHIVDHYGSGNLTCIEELQTSPTSQTDESEEAEGIQNTGMIGLETYGNQNKKRSFTFEENK